MNTLKTIAAMAAMATLGTSGSAIAQHPAPPQGEPGAGAGFRGGQQGPGRGGPMMMRPAGPRILMIREVQRELKLTEEQIEDLREALPMGPPPGPGGFGRGGPEGPRPRDNAGPGSGRPEGQGGRRGDGPGGPPPDPGMMQERMRQVEAEIRQILNSNQYRRYQEISLQQEGPAAMSRPDVARKVGLSEEQVDQIRQILEANRPQPPVRMGEQHVGGRPGQGEPGARSAPAARGGQGPGDQDEMRRRMDAARDANAKRILEVLNAGQRSKWQSLLGKPFKMPEMRGPGGPGGPDRRGPGGPPKGDGGFDPAKDLGG